MPRSKHAAIYGCGRVYRVNRCVNPILAYTLRCKVKQSKMFDNETDAKAWVKYQSELPIDEYLGTAYKAKLFWNPIINGQPMGLTTKTEERSQTAPAPANT
jgi:hypothetical protein